MAGMGPPMASCPQLRVSLLGLLDLGLLLVVMGAASAQNNSTTSTTTPSSQSLLTTSASVPGPNIAAIVAPTVILGILLLAGVAVAMVLRVKKKRQTEGTYRPSSEEQTGARSVQAPDALKLPKEERLI